VEHHKWSRSDDEDGLAGLRLAAVHLVAADGERLDDPSWSKESFLDKCIFRASRRMRPVTPLQGERREALGFS